MQARIEILYRQVLNLKEQTRDSDSSSIDGSSSQSQKDADKLATYTEIKTLMDCRELHLRSELQSREECDAIAFFVAFVQSHYSENGSSLRLDPKLSLFLNKIKYNGNPTPPVPLNLIFRNPVETLKTYHEMVHWGLVILNSYQSLKAGMITPEAQEFLNQAAAPLIFLNLAAYKEMLSDEKADRYRVYIDARHKDCARLPELQSQLRSYQWHRSWGSVISLVPGLFFLKNGLTESWSYIKQGKYGSALFGFVLIAGLSALSPLGALFNYYAYGFVLDQTKKTIAEMDPSNDYAVTRVLNESEYNAFKAFRKEFKEQHRQDIDGDLTSMLNKPKKHVERFTEGAEEKVRLYLDKQQAERFDGYQAFRSGRQVGGASTFFKGLKASQQESIATADLLHMEVEKIVP